MAGWYEITQANDGQYRFVLKAGNGEIILNSELYKAKASAVNGIESVQKNNTHTNKKTRFIWQDGTKL
ncbi:YegP family protein, partial [Pseudomonas aeruginosa]|uniref:YegP family protein n=1 Tax=Pseudomonas aeruginosa TaxID=287 RepID=UPI003007D5D5